MVIPRSLVIIGPDSDGPNDTLRVIYGSYDISVPYLGLDNKAKMIILVSNKVIAQADPNLIRDLDIIMKLVNDAFDCHKYADEPLIAPSMTRRAEVTSSREVTKLNSDSIPGIANDQLTKP